MADETRTTLGDPGVQPDPDAESVDPVALGEDEHQLALVVEQAVHVGRVGGHGADLRQQHAEARVTLEEVLDGEVHRTRVGMLLLDRLRDHRGVGGQRPGVV